MIARISGKNAFTLIELLIVVVIVGILASMGLPAYNKTKEVALGKEAKANLKLISAAEKIYKLENTTYKGCVCYSIGNPGDFNDCDTALGTGGCNYNLNLTLNPANWDYYVTNVTATTFTARGARKGSGGYLDCQYSIAENDGDGDPDANSSCP